MYLKAKNSLHTTIRIYHSFSEKSDDKIYIYDLELEDCGGIDLMTSPNSSIMPLANYSLQGKIIQN